MKIKYYERDCTVGHRDPAYFEIEKDCSKSPTGKSYHTFRLVSIRDNELMPESIYEHIAKAIEISSEHP